MTTNTAAGRSDGRPAQMRLRASMAPSEPPITIISCDAMSTPGHLFSCERIALCLVPAHRRQLCRERLDQARVIVLDVTYPDAHRPTGHARRGVAYQPDAPKRWTARNPAGILT